MPCEEKLGENEKWLTELLDDADACHRLTDWEYEFCQSMREAIASFGKETFVSGKQWEILDRIARKVYKT